VTHAGSKSPANLGRVTASVADQTYNVDTYFTAQPNWYQEEIDIAFQKDGNYRQEPYSMWLEPAHLSPDRREPPFPL